MSKLYKHSGMPRIYRVWYFSYFKLSNCLNSGSIGSSHKSKSVLNGFVRYGLMDSNFFHEYYFDHKIVRYFYYFRSKEHPGSKYYITLSNSFRDGEIDRFHPFPGNFCMLINMRKNAIQ